MADPSVWHGTADMVVSSANADVIIDQWRDRVGLGDATSETSTVEGQRRTIWCDLAGRKAVERIDVAGIAHCTPLGTRGDGEYGQPGPHMLEVGISSTRHLRPIGA